MISLRTLVFLVGTAIISGNEVKIETFKHSPHSIYRLPVEFADKKAFLLACKGIPNLASVIPSLASLVPLPINGIAGFWPMLGHGVATDCDHSGHIVSSPPVLFEPVPEAPELPIKEAKPLAPIPEAPILSPLAFPELPLAVEEHLLTVPCPSGGFWPMLGHGVATDCDHSGHIVSSPPVLFEPVPEAPELPIVEDKPLAPIPEAPILSPLAFPELPLAVEEHLLTVPCPSGEIIIEAPKEPESETDLALEPLPEAPVLPTFALPEAVPEFVEEFKPLGPIPEAPELGPFTSPELPSIMAVEKDETIEFVEDHKLTIPEAPVLADCIKADEKPTPIVYIPELPAPMETVEIFESPMIEELKPIPELPPLTTTTFPEEEEILEEPKVSELKPIPEAPELPPLPFNFAAQPILTPVVTEVVEEPAKVICGVPECPKLPSPEFCAHTVIRERVIPKFIEKVGDCKIVNFNVGSEMPFMPFIPGHPAAKFGLPVYSNMI